jgi:hypothetical protein
MNICCPEWMGLPLKAPSNASGPKGEDGTSPIKLSTIDIVKNCVMAAC